MKKTPGIKFGKFARRMMIYLLLLSLLTVLLLSGLFYWQGTQRLFTYVENDLVKTLETSREQLDRMFTTVENIFIDLLRNRDLYAFFRTYEDEEFNIHQANEMIAKAISNHTLHAPEVLSVQFLTSKWVFSENNTAHASVYNFQQSDIYRWAQESHQRYSWIPTYDFTVAYHHFLLQDTAIPIRDRYILSLAGLYEPYYYFAGDYSLQYLPAEVERPVLVINVKEEYLKKLLIRDQQSGHGTHLIVDGGGRIIAHERDDQLLTQMNSAQWEALSSCEEPSGFFTTYTGGEKIRVYYVTLSTGWRMVAQVPEAVIHAEIMRDIGGSLFIAALFVLVLGAVLALLVTRQLSRPLNQMLHAIEQTGQGHFDVVVPGTRDDFNLLIEAYNDMNRQIHQLIEDIYLVRLREKETQLLALKYQTNPHFLNNALTILYISARRESQSQTSGLILTLSEMMRYVVRDQRDLVSLREELTNVRHYMRLIDVGYEGGIGCEIEVAEGLLDTAIPKLCLQPLMENAVMHGLHNRKGDGLITVQARRGQGGVLIHVRDNGEGVPEGFTLERQQRGESTSIGLDNVHKRIQLLFGAEYGVTVENNDGGGACVTLHLPEQADRDLGE